MRFTTFFKTYDNYKEMLLVHPLLLHTTQLSINVFHQKRGFLQGSDVPHASWLRACADMPNVIWKPNTYWVIVKDRLLVSYICSDDKYVFQMYFDNQFSKTSLVI